MKSQGMEPQAQGGPTPDGEPTIEDVAQFLAEMLIDKKEDREFLFEYSGKVYEMYFRETRTISPNTHGIYRIHAGPAGVKCPCCRGTGRKAKAIPQSNPF